MPRKTNQPMARNPRAKQPAGPNLGRASYTITEFCNRVGIGRGTYLNLRKSGLGPREMRPSGTPYGAIRISAAAEAEWVAACERRTVDEALQAVARAKRARARADAE